MQTPAKAGTGPDQDGKLRSVRTITIGQYANNFWIKKTKRLNNTRLRKENKMQKNNAKRKLN